MENRLRAAATAALSVLLFTPGSPAVGQELRLGVEVGASLFTFGGEGLEDLDEYRTGLVGGVTAAYRLNDLMWVESGARWVEKGAEGEVIGFEEAISADVSLSYFQVPVLLRVSFLPARAVRPSVAAGSAVSFETRCRASQDPAVVAALVSCGDEGRPRTDVGLLFGAGVSWRFGPAEVLVEGLYHLGLRDIETVDALGTRNRGFTLTPRVSLPVLR